MKHITILLSLLGLLLFNNVKADSPITSTGFSSAYQSEAIVIKASNAKGLLNKELMEYLADKSKPIAIKMAVINQLSWDMEGKTNGKTFFEYLQKTKGYTDENDLQKKGSGDELLCMAYLKVMDNYFVVDDALMYAELAVERNKESYTFNIIAALIKAQKVFDSDWCQVYKSTDKVRTNNSLNIDMNSEAITIIFDYMDLYKSYCK
jgi:hypothetical protein